MAFNYTFRSDDVSGWDADTRDLVENRDRELELYSTTIDDSFLNLNANNLTSGTVPSTRITGSYSGITQVGTLSAGIASYSIGDTGPAGGKVFITPSTSGNTTGLYFEVAPVAAEVLRSWAQFSPINYQATSAPLAQFNTIGSGKSNTVAIVNQGNSNSSTCAAKYCDDFTYNGFSDWFLASKDELAEMYTNRVVLGNNFSPDPYWSSSEYDANNAWLQDFYFGYQNYYRKSPTFYVRPVRSFSAIGLNVIGSTVVRAAATQDGVIITGGGFGIYDYAVTILPTILTASRNVTLPDVSGTMITTGNLSSITSVGTLSSLNVTGTVGIGIAVPTSKLHVVGSFSRGAPVTKTANFTLADSENWIICNGTGSITVTLPAASTQVGREISLKNIAAFTVVSASSNVVPLVGGAAGTAILPATAGSWVTLVSDGTNWIIMQS